MGQALLGNRLWNSLNITTDQWDEGYREGLLQSVIKRHKPAVYRDNIERLKAAPLRGLPEFLNCSMDIMRLCCEDGQANQLTQWCEEFADMPAMHAALLRKWCAEVEGAASMLGFLALSETGKEGFFCVAPSLFDVIYFLHRFLALSLCGSLPVSLTLTHPLVLFPCLAIFTFISLSPSLSL